MKDESFLAFGKNKGNIVNAERTIYPLKIRNEKPKVLAHVNSKRDNPTITKNKKVRI